MAPEQFEGLASPKSDQYALGCIAYELLTGWKVFSIPHPSLEAWWYHHAKVEPVPPRQYNPYLPAPIEQAILIAIAKDRVKRHRDVAAFIQAMTGINEQRRAEGGVRSSPEAWVEAGIVHIQAGRYEEALAFCDRALQLDPTYAQAYTNKAIALTGLNRFQEALTFYDRALQLGSTNAGVYANKANLLIRLNRYEEALAACDRALQLDSTNAGAYANRGSALAHLRQYAEALAAFDRALQLDPTEAMASAGKDAVLTWLNRYAK